MLIGLQEYLSILYIYHESRCFITALKFGKVKEYCTTVLEEIQYSLLREVVTNLG